MKRRKFWAYGIVLIALLLVCTWAFMTGASQKTLGQTWHTLFFDQQSNYFHTLMTIRLPRIVAALVSGAALAVAGVFFQATLRNAIADPSLLGISAGADLFALAGTVLLPRVLGVSIMAALIGGVVALGLLLCFHGRTNSYQLILIGVALNAMFVGVKALFGAPGGSTSGASLATLTWPNVLVLLVLGLIGLVVSVLVAPWANYMKIGDAQLTTIGLPVRWLQISLLALTVLLTSTVTAVIGVMPFLGIIVPHLSRFWVGHDYADVVPFSILLGAGSLLAVDTIGRTVVMPTEISAATLLTVIGGPVLIWVLTRKGLTYED